MACLDEAGRGPLAGPVVAAAVMIKNPKLIGRLTGQILKIKDSKKLTGKKREEFYKILTNPPADGLNIEWGIGRVSEKKIDKINILEATKLAMKKAVADLNCKLKIKNRKIDYLILDGKMKLDLPISQKSIIKADESVFSCVAASILAKVTRDRMMQKYHKKYPQYGFNNHKGYPTKNHFKALKKYGSCKIHRKSFRPVKACKKK